MVNRNRTVDKRRRRRRGEEGVVLLMVILLVVMFSGLGLLAMRRVQGELRASGAYMDSTQASEAAETAVMMVATDMRRNWRAANDPSKCENYYAQFHNALLSGNFDNIKTGFSDVFNHGDDRPAESLGKLPVASLNGTAPTALTEGPLSHAYADVSLSQTAPQPAPPPPGFSADDQSRTYDWYYFTVTSQAHYGFGGASRTVEVDTEGDTELEAITAIDGNAVVRVHMKIGPVDSIQSN